MLKKDIKYTDFNGDPQEETHYFNLNKTELFELTAEFQGSLQAYFKHLVDKKDEAGILRELKRLILSTYGVKSEDGKRFIKTDAVREEFSQTAAYDTLFLELLEGEDTFMTFMKSVLPAELRDDFDKALKEAGKEEPKSDEDTTPKDPT